jgi:hypothetical protein
MAYLSRTREIVMSAERTRRVPGARFPKTGIDPKLAHDLTNMLTVVMANARLVRRNAADVDRSAELAGIIEAQARKALELIQQAITAQDASSG